MPFVSLTRAIFRRAEFGFFGVTVATRVHTPRRCGAATRRFRPWPDLRPGVVTFFFCGVRPLRTSWFVLGTAGHGSGRARASPHDHAAYPPRRGGRSTNPRPRRRWDDLPVRVRGRARRGAGPLPPDRRGRTRDPRRGRPPHPHPERALRAHLGHRLGGARERHATEDPRPPGRSPRPDLWGQRPLRHRALEARCPR